MGRSPLEPGVVRRGADPDTGNSGERRRDGSRSVPMTTAKPSPRKPRGRKSAGKGGRTAPRIIRKYPNRRLYDTSESRYVTLADVRRLVIDGIDFVVPDRKSQQDITRSILLQILAEQESEGHEPVLTNRAIEQIIRFYGNNAGNVVSRYIEQSILTFLEHQDQFRKRLRDPRLIGWLWRMTEVTLRQTRWNDRAYVPAEAYHPLLCA